MLTHPDAEALALYAETGSGAEVEAHLRTCQECLSTVVQARNMRDLEQEGLLGTVRPGRRLSAYLKGDSKPAGALGVLAGLFAGGLMNHHSEPSFAVGEIKDHEPERLDPHHASSHSDMTNVIGTPTEDAHEFPGKQGFDDTCAIRCQEFLIRQFTGVHLPESYYVEEAKSHGWYHKGLGTEPHDIGNQLELHNIPIHRYEHANVFNLTAELAQGHKVIITVDSQDLWTQHPLLNDLRHKLGFAAADHAVVVSGIDTSDSEHVKVIVSDPGTGEVAARYPLDQFVDAWKDGDFFMVATQNPPPESLHLPEMQHFDYDLGHIDHVGAMPYEEFHQFLDEGDHSQSDFLSSLHGHDDDHTWHHDDHSGDHHS